MCEPETTCARQNCLYNAWAESGKVYCYRKLQNDLIDQGESICPNRGAGLAQLTGMRAQIGYKRYPASNGGKPSVVVENALAGQFDVDATDRIWDESIFAIGPRTIVE